MKSHGQLFYEALQRAALDAGSAFRSESYERLPVKDVKVFERAAADYDEEIYARTSHQKPIIGHRPPATRRTSGSI